MNLFNTLIQYRGWKLYDLPRSLFTAIDDGVYGMIGNVYELIMDIANVSVFSTDTLQAFYGKIYALLSIFMLFKLSFSIVSYILDPSKTFDKNAGFGKLITNILVMFIMMLSAPVAFKYLTKLQNAILDDNVIENFVFNIDGSSDSYSFKVTTDSACKSWNAINSEFEPTAAVWTPASVGDGISLRMYRVFFNLADDANGKFGKKSLDYSFKFCSNKKINNATIKTMTGAVNDYVEKSGKGTWYVIEYRMFLATAFGVFVLLMFISIAFDIAVRAAKLGFLQLIAPVPIISYIDPKSGKDGIFQRWIKEVGKTWASLFIRLFSVYFAVFIVSKVEIIFPKDYQLKSSMFFVELFVIIGALMFAKQLPQLLEQLFPGMKMGNMQLNPFKKVADEALGGKALLGTGAALAAAGLSGATNAAHRIAQTAQNVRDEAGFENKARALFRGIGRTAGSTLAGATRGGINAFGRTSKDGRLFKGAWDGYQTSMFSKKLRDDTLRKAGLENAGFIERARFGAGSVAADLARYAGVLNRGQREQLEAAAQDLDIKNRQNALDEEKYDIANRKQNDLNNANIDGRQRQLDLEKFNTGQEKKRTLQPFKDYSGYATEIKKRIDNHSAVKAAEKEKNRAEAIGDASLIEKAEANLDYAKNFAANDLYRNDNDVKDLVGRMNDIRNNNEELRNNTSEAFEYDASSDEYTFKSSSIYGTENYSAMIERRYDDVERQYQERQDNINEDKRVIEARYADMERDIKERQDIINEDKRIISNNEEHNPMSSAKLQNDQRFNGEKEKPGFKPSPNQSSQANISDNSQYSNLGRHGGHHGGGTH